jgi:hypothetical protein
MLKRLGRAEAAKGRDGGRYSKTQGRLALALFFGQVVDGR